MTCVFTKYLFRDSVLRTGTAGSAGSETPGSRDGRKGSSSVVDTRSTLRYPIDLPARLRVGETELACRIRNLSLGGAFISGATLTIGTRCRLRFSAPNMTFDNWCIARWTTADGTGLMFERLQPMDTHQLARFMRSASRNTE